MMDESEEIRREISTFVCPVCGAGTLTPFTTTAQGDCLEFKAIIVCRHCRMFRAESTWYSYYRKGDYVRDSLQEVTDKVRPYIKKFSDEA